ncbi:hypothetical protein [Kibdelosporangium philippinense]
MRPGSSARAGAAMTDTRGMVTDHERRGHGSAARSGAGWTERS